MFHRDCYDKTGSGNAMGINWTPWAIDSLIETVRFIDYHFGKRVAQNIRFRIEKSVGVLIENPLAGKVAKEFSSDRMEIRFIVINKRSKVFYTLNEECVHILLVWDTRQNVILLNGLLTLKS